MIKLVSHGDFKKAESFLEKCKESIYKKQLAKYGEEGVALLAEATPKRTGKTAASWTYRIEQTATTVSIIWENTNTVFTRGQEVSVAILIQYGHGTKGGGFVKGRDYINPVIQPYFDKMADDMWEGIVNRK